MPEYAVYICGPGDCPVDDRFVHENFFGTLCVPSDFSFTTGRSRKVKKQRLWGRWWWTGGCQGAAVGLIQLVGGHPRFPKSTRGPMEIRLLSHETTL